MCFNSELFDEEYEAGGQELDDTQITTTLLYFSEPELKEFKALAKQAIRIEFGAEAMTKGNLSDLLLIILRKQYAPANTNSQAPIN